jgi:arylformamidase
MKIYDVSQELLSSAVYPGDPSPVLTRLCSMEDGDLYNLSHFSACAHNGTHIDAPRHFIKDGKTIGEMSLDSTVGMSYVAVADGILDKNEIQRILTKAREHSPDAARRILIKGGAVLSADGARALCENEALLIGTESQSVGPIDAPMEVHRILLANEIALLEGLRLGEVDEGEYFLCAAPINIGIAEGAPARAILVDFHN